MTQIPEQGGSEVIKAPLLWPSETSKSQVRVASLFHEACRDFCPNPRPTQRDKLYFYSHS